MRSPGPQARDTRTRGIGAAVTVPVAGARQVFGNRS